MNARMVFPLLLLVAAAATPLASGQLSAGFYKTTCPDAEKIIFGIVEKKFKEDPGTAAGLLRLVFHDCFANGCDASILIDPLSNQASEKEAGPNISVKGYDIIDDIKTELEKQCKEVVSCADIVAVAARDAVKLTGGPDYAVPTGRRDAVVSNREDADNLPGPDIAVPKLLSDFSKKGFDLEESVALLAGGHTIGSCKCFFIEADAAPIDPDYKKNISTACDGANRDRGSVPMDQVTPNVFDGSYFALALAKKMPLTVDRLMGLDPKTEPVLKAMAAKPESFIPVFVKAMEKLSVLQVLTGKDGEIRKSCGEFNNPQPTNDGPSVIRISSLNPDQMGLVGPGTTTRKVKANGAEAVSTVTPGPEVKKEAGGSEEIKPALGKEAEIAKATGPIEATGNKVLGDEPGSKLPGGVEAAKTLNEAKIENEPPKKLRSDPAATTNVPAGGEEAAKMARDEEFRQRNLAKLRRRQEAAAATQQAAAGAGEAAKVPVTEEMGKKKLRGGQH
ncbi:hypothetical protein QOZ80_3AG0234070 [Eleusine coracana subsp. coracana]|nr:hypothetical protein QOZ80_3AG0234070 [Eleusine coracana subsp. coracana]